MVFYPKTYGLEITSWLEKRFSGKFICLPGKEQQANGLKITSPRLTGYAFVYEPSSSGSLLLALHETDTDHNPSVWDIKGLEDFDKKIEAWAFPRTWTIPAPIDPEKEKSRLKKLLNGLSVRGAEFSLTIAPYNPLSELLTDESLQELDDDLKAVQKGIILRNFPCDETGRMKLKSCILLRKYESVKAPGKDRAVCLAAIGPERRSDAQNIHIQLCDLIVENQSHNWQMNEWLWQDKKAPDWSRWGLDPQILADSSCEAATAASCLALLDSGLIVEALKLYKIECSKDVYRILGGERVSPVACCANPTQEWTEMMTKTLRESAPWLFPRAIENAIRAHEMWASGKKGRNRFYEPELKLLIFPGQTHQRKASLMLASDKDCSNMRLEISATASNARLAEIQWKRPIWVDFERFGISSELAGSLFNDTL